MVKLNQFQADYFREVCNIGAGRAAKQLSLLLDDHIEMDIPEVHLSGVSDLQCSLDFGDDDCVICVYQNLTGCFEGRALLVFQGDDSKILIDAVLSDVPVMSAEEEHQFQHESMIEIGNIIVSSCVSALADMLQQEVALTVPTYTEQPLKEILEQYTDISVDPPTALAVTTLLRASSQSVSGAVIIAFEPVSLQLLLKTISEMQSG